MEAFKFFSLVSQISVGKWAKTANEKVNFLTIKSSHTVSKSCIVFCCALSLIIWPCEVFYEAVGNLTNLLPLQLKQFLLVLLHPEVFKNDVSSWCPVWMGPYHQVCHVVGVFNSLFVKIPNSIIILSNNIYLLQRFL